MPAWSAQWSDARGGAVWVWRASEGHDGPVVEAAGERGGGGRGGGGAARAGASQVAAQVLPRDPPALPVLVADRPAPGNRVLPNPLVRRTVSIAAL